MDTPFTFDKNYNIAATIEDVYSDGLDDLVDAINVAAEKGGITKEAAEVLLKIALAKEARKGLSTLGHWAGITTTANSEASLIIGLSKHTRYAR